MAEALLSNEPRTLQEFGTIRESSTLQDISLAEGVAGVVGAGAGAGVQERKEEIMKNVKDTDHEADDSEHKIKTNSLKRFFRMPSKKKGGEDADPDNCPVELAAGDVNKFKKHNPNATEESNCASKAELKRSNFRSGRMPSNSMHSERSQRDLTGTFSRSSFRSSISSYWNTVFNKQKKNKKTHENDQEKDKESSDLNEKSNENEEKSDEIANANEKYPSVVDNILTEEIHALKISDENDSK